MKDKRKVEENTHTHGSMSVLIFMRSNLFIEANGNNNDFDDKICERLEWEKGTHTWVILMMWLNYSNYLSTFSLFNDDLKDYIMF
jgi:hypothetical protein